MKDDSSKIIIVLIIIILILGGIFIIRILGKGSEKNFRNSKNSYSKSEIIELVKSEKNKSNYEVVYTIDKTKYKIKYLNRKMRFEGSDNKTSSLAYIDFEKNTTTVVDDFRKVAIIQNNNLIDEYYYVDDIVKYLESSNCKIEGEDIISNREAIVIEYEGIEKIGNQFLFNDENLSNTDTTVNEIVFNMKIWIDKETGFLLQTIAKANNMEQKTVFDLKINTVNIEDVAIPNLSQYKVTDITTK